MKSSRDGNNQTPGLGVHLLPFLVAPYVRGPTYKKEGRLDVKCCNHFYRLPLGKRHFPLPIRRFSILRRHTHDPSFLRCDSMSGRDDCQCDAALEYLYGCLTGWRRVTSVRNVCVSREREHDSPTSLCATIIVVGYCLIPFLSERRELMALFDDLVARRSADH